MSATTMSFGAKAFERLRVRPGFGFMFALSLGLLPFLGPPVFPGHIGNLRYAGAVLAGGAAFFAMHRSRISKEVISLRRLLAAFGLMLLVFSSLFAFTFHMVKSNGRDVAVSLGFWWRPNCCGTQAIEECFHDLDLTDDSITKCWGDFSVALARFFLFVSYVMTTLLGGASVGVFLLGQQRHAPQWPYDLFISYAREDEEFVTKLAAGLKRHGFSIWLDKNRFLTGDSIDRRIEKGLRASRCFAVVLSPNSVSSEWVTAELGAARFQEEERENLGIQPYIFPILKEDCKIPESLSGRNWADFRDYKHNWDAALSQLKQSFAQPQKQAQGWSRRLWERIRRRPGLRVLP
jgi:TIR domain-containing protein